MANRNVKLVPGELGEGFCFTDLQALYVRMFARGHAELPDGYEFAVVQHAEPDPEDRDKIWHRLDANGAYERTYYFYDGAWVSPHATPANSDEVRIWKGTEAELNVYDGGDEASSARLAAGAYGPMWMIDSEFAFRMPIGVGELPASETELAVGDTGGSDEITIARENLPAENISVDLPIIGQSAVGSPSVVGNTYGSTAIDGSGLAVDSTSSSLSSRYYAKGRIEELGDGTPINSMPPYKAVYFIKRTGRVFYKAT